MWVRVGYKNDEMKGEGYRLEHDKEYRGIIV